MNWQVLMVVFWIVYLLLFFVVRPILKNREEKKRRQRFEEEQERLRILDQRAGLPFNPMDVDEARERYIAECLRRHDRQKRTLETGIATVEATITRATTAIAETQREEARTTAVLEGFGEAVGQLRMKALADYERIAGLEQVNSVKIGEGYVDVMTNAIEIEHGANRYNLGEFVIRIMFDKGRVLIGKFRPGRGLIHPHVDKDGRPIMAGDLKLAISQFLASYDFANVVEIMIGFLQSYDERSALVRIEEFARRR